MKSWPTQVEKKQENKEVAQAGVAGSCRQTFNFVLSWEHREPRLFMVPVRWKEGKKRQREGLPLSWSCETVGQREETVIPITLQEAHENTLITAAF